MKQFDALSRSLNPFDSHFLEASAGTGKTFAIEHLVVRLLIEGPSALLIEEILVVTFTRAATRELKRRIHRNLKAIQSQLLQESSSLDYVQALLESGQAKVALERIEAALICFDRACIYTLHGFCFRLLKEFAFEAKVGYALPDPDESDSLSLKEREVKHYLKETSFLASYSPLQIHQILGKYQRDPSRLISALTKLSSEGKTIADVPSHEELRTRFLQAIKNLYPINPERFKEDITFLKSRYLKMSGPQILVQINILAEVLSSKQCSLKQFDQLLKGDSFLEKMQQKYLKKKIKPLQESDLHYPGLLDLLVQECLPWILKAKDTSSTLLRLAKQIQEKQQELIEAHEQFSPDLLLLKVQKALESPPFCAAVSRKFKAAILDEFQDTDPVQWSIVKKLFLDQPSCTLCLVGDPKQSIYSFRSADVYVYLDAAEQMGEGSKKVLNTNFRSTPQLVAALNFLFSKAHTQWMALPGKDTALEVSAVKAGSSLSALDEKAPIEFFIAEDRKGRSRRFPTASMLEKKVYPYLASEIFSLHTQKGVAYHEIAILIKDRFQGQEVVDYLKRAGIPANVQRGGLLIRLEGYLSLKEILKAVYSPYDNYLVKAALAMPVIGWSAEELKQDIQYSQLLSAKAHFKRLQDVLFTLGFGPFFQAFLETKWTETGLPLLASLMQYGDSAWYQELRRLCELILEEEANGEINYLKYVESLAVDAQREDPRFQVFSAEEKGSVIVMTLHRSKGLEFDVVFALGLGSRQSPSDLVTIRQEGQNLLTVFDEEDPACQRVLDEADAEKQRLLYVALTRAKKKLYIPLFLEKEKQQLSGKEASASELFLAHLLKKHTPSEDLYQTLATLRSGDALALIEQMQPHVQACLLEESALPDLSCVSKEVILSAAPPLTLTIHKQPLLSFSSLAEKSKPEIVKASLPEIPADAPLSIHTLPWGSETGIFVHHLLEKVLKKGLHHPLNPARIADLVRVETSLSLFEPWQAVLSKWIIDLLQTPLSTFSIADIPSSQLQLEMEFLYPCQAGMMKGFADLVFQFEGKYYLLDWKTNYLGQSDADYTQQKMQEAMTAHHYELQASIYTEALERYVKLFDNRPFFSCFGGAFYYFVRGKAVYQVRRLTC